MNSFHRIEAELLQLCIHHYGRYSPRIEIALWEFKLSKNSILSCTYCAMILSFSVAPTGIFLSVLLAEIRQLVMPFYVWEKMAGQTLWYRRDSVCPTTIFRLHWGWKWKTVNLSTTRGVLTNVLWTTVFQNYAWKNQITLFTYKVQCNKKWKSRITWILQLYIL